MIVDASVAIKWLVIEDNSDRANSLIDQGGLVAPDLIFAEVANGMWKKCQRGELAGLPHNLEMLAALIDEIEPAAALFKRAAGLAIELKHPAYDCFYLALAEARHDVVVTADTRFLRVCAASPYARLIVALGQTV